MLSDPHDTIALRHGPGWRLTIDDAITVAGFHVFFALDPDDPRPDAIVVFHIDIWPDEWPSARKG